MARVAAALMAVVLASACARTLPDQDRRITVTPPVAKLPVEDLWKEYKDNASAANGKYWGHAIEISGKVSRIATDAPPAIRFTLEGESGVNALLLDDTAAAVLKAAVVGQRLRLKCFCAGLATDLILRSCIQPQ